MKKKTHQKEMDKRTVLPNTNKSHTGGEKEVCNKQHKATTLTAAAAASYCFPFCSPLNCLQLYPLCRTKASTYPPSEEQQQEDDGGDDCSIEPSSQSKEFEIVRLFKSLLYFLHHRLKRRSEPTITTGRTIRGSQEEMGILYDDVVMVMESQKQGEPTVITVNCPDKTGLGCDLCRIILVFGLSIARGDVSTDGKWCYFVFWVVGEENTPWGLLKKRLMEACPSCSSTSGIFAYRLESQPPKPPGLFLLKLSGYDRIALLHDVTKVLCEAELTIMKVKVSTTPDGRVMDLFFITDTRELLHTQERQKDTCERLKDVLGDAMISCEIEIVGPEIAGCSQGSFLPSVITDVLNSERPNEHLSGSLTSNNVSITVDNSLSPAHTLVQIICHDHKGLLYDIMRTLKDYNIQVSYGRFTVKQRRNGEIDLFIVQADGKKIIDPNKQNAMCSRLRKVLLQPLKVAVVSRGPDMELLVANPVELSGNGRPLVFYDITLALKSLKTCIFSAEIRRHVIGDREWEIYRVLLDEGESLAIPRNYQIRERVWKMLMGWDQ